VARGRTQLADVLGAGHDVAADVVRVVAATARAGAPSCRRSAPGARGRTARNWAMIASWRPRCSRAGRARTSRPGGYRRPSGAESARYCWPTRTNGRSGIRPAEVSRSFAHDLGEPPDRCSVPALRAAGWVHGTPPRTAKSTLNTDGPCRNRLSPLATRRGQPVTQDLDDRARGLSRGSVTSAPGAGRRGDPYPGLDLPAVVGQHLDHRVGDRPRATLATTQPCRWPAVKRPSPIAEVSGRFSGCRACAAVPAHSARPGRWRTPWPATWPAPRSAGRTGSAQRVLGYPQQRALMSPPQSSNVAEFARRAFFSACRRPSPRRWPRPSGAARGIAPVGGCTSSISARTTAARTGQVKLGHTGEPTPSMCTAEQLVLQQAGHKPGRCAGPPPTTSAASSQ